MRALSPSAVMMPSGLRLGVNVPVMGEAFMTHGKMHFIVLVVTH